MKKVLIILTILLFSACSKTSDIESCRYSIFMHSYAYFAEIDECTIIYNEIESANSKSKVDTESVLDGYSILIHFDFVDSESVNYILNRDGTLLYDMDDVQYSTEIRKELFTELLDNIDKQRGIPQ